MLQIAYEILYHVWMPEESVSEQIYTYLCKIVKSECIFTLCGLLSASAHPPSPAGSQWVGIPLDSELLLEL